MCCKTGWFFAILGVAVIVSAAVVSSADHHLRSESTGIPAGYRLVYAQDFEDADHLGPWVYTDPAAWSIGEINGNHFIEHTQQSRYEPPHRSPLNIAMIGDLQLRDFVLEVDLMQTGRDYGHRDMCLFFGFQDPAHFYYTHTATATDDHAHNIFIVNDAPRTKISVTTTEGFDWGQDAWQHARLVRDSVSGTIALYINDMNTPIMTATDTTFDWGHIGFGSFDDTGRIDNIRIYAPFVKEEAPGFFRAE